MSSTSRPANFYYRLLIAVSGLVLLGVSTSQHQAVAFHWWAMLPVVFFSAFLVNFPIDLFQTRISLIQVIALGSGLIYGPLPSAWATLLGILLGQALGWLRRRLTGKTISWPDWSRWVDAGFVIGWNVIPLLLILDWMGWMQGVADTDSSTQRIWASASIAVILFAAFHTAIFLVDFHFRRTAYKAFSRRDLFALLILEFLPVSFILLVVDAYPRVGAGALLALGGVSAIMAVLMYGMLSARVDLERRVQELSTLQHVSQTMRSTLDLQQLLSEIHLQVTQLMGADSFYVALFDQDKNELWYPLAVKLGQRQEWQRRAVSDRLTDRVILERRPILMTQEETAPVGLPPSEATPYSWVGVPLISPERTIGCLAVFDVNERIRFSDGDLALLGILSGQVSVAIENALLYQQAQERARQLETLNQLTGALTASLDPQQVLEQVCASVALVGDSQQSAVFLLDPGDDSVRLAYVNGFPPAFSERNQQFSITSSRRTRCLRSGRPVFVSDVRNSSLALDLVQLFIADQVRAFADFPLITPDGQIGFLSVYYSEPHDFRVEEIDLLQTLASQAAMALSNARLHARTDQALERRVHQLAILESVGRELSAELLSDRLFTLILEYALEYTNSTCGAVGVCDLDTSRLLIKASRGYQQIPAYLPAGQGISGQVIQSKQVVNIRDVSETQAFIDARDGKTRSQLSVPLIYEGGVLGVITLESSDAHAFTEGDQAFVTQLASQAAIALVNADLYRETQRRLREQSTLYLVSTHLAGAVEPADVAEIVWQAMDAALQPNATGVYLWSESRQGFHLFNHVNRANSEGHLPDFLALEHLAVITDDLQSGRLVRFIPDAARQQLSFAKCSDCQILIFPLTAGQETLGLVVLHLAADASLGEDELQLLKAVVAQGSIALQNARLYTDAHLGRERLSAVINSVGEGIMLLDITGRILLTNDQLHVFTHLAKGQLQHQLLQDLPEQVLQMFGYQREDIKFLLADLGRDQVPVAPKLVYKLSEGVSERVFERLATPVWGQGGRVIGWMIVIRDVTEEFEIGQARETITQTLVHDLRSPMSAVIGALDFLEESLSSSATSDVVEQSFRVAKRSSRRVLGLIEALLDIARLQSGHMEINLEALDIFPVVESLVVDFKPVANDAGIILHNELDPQTPRVLADRDKLERILMNLVDNAIKFTPEGGRVVVSAGAITERMLTIQVRDSGPGIPEEYREKIFDRFEQVPGQRGRRRGSGLGLTFCRLAVEVQGGRIWVDAAPQGGSLFRFTLPLDRQPQEA